MASSLRLRRSPVVARNSMRRRFQQMARERSRWEKRRREQVVRLLSCERLEERQMLSNVSWTGAGGSSDWNNPLNWDASSVPGPSDDVYIAASSPGGVAVTISSGTDSINSLHDGKSLKLSGGT